MKSKIVFCVLITSLIVSACSNPNSSEPTTTYHEEYTGTLKWGGPPALDGSGLLFYTGNKTYGVPGDKSDYDHIFKKDENEVDVRVNFLLTNEKTVRGWGATYNKIEIFKIERLEISLN